MTWIITRLLDHMNVSMQNRLEEIVSPLVEKMGFELWGLEYSERGNQALLRLFIDRDGGVTLDDCALVSEQVSALLDVEDPISLAYRLEVSSPGLDRVLFRPDQYRRYIGQRLKVRLRWSVEGRRNVQGRLLDCDDQLIKLEADGGDILAIPLESIHRARLIYGITPGLSDDQNATVIDD